MIHLSSFTSAVVLAHAGSGAPDPTDASSQATLTTRRTAIQDEIHQLRSRILQSLRNDFDARSAYYGVNTTDWSRLEELGTQLQLVTRQIAQQTLQRQFVHAALPYANIESIMESFGYGEEFREKYAGPEQLEQAVIADVLQRPMAAAAIADTGLSKDLFIESVDAVVRDNIPDFVLGGGRGPHGEPLTMALFRNGPPEVGEALRASLAHFFSEQVPVASRAQVETELSRLPKPSPELALKAERLWKDLDIKPGLSDAEFERGTVELDRAYQRLSQARPFADGTLRLDLERALDAVEYYYRNAKVHRAAELYRNVRMGWVGDFHGDALMSYADINQVLAAVELLRDLPQVEAYQEWKKIHGRLSREIRSGLGQAKELVAQGKLEEARPLVETELPKLRQQWAEVEQQVAVLQEAAAMLWEEEINRLIAEAGPRDTDKTLVWQPQRNAIGWDLDRILGAGKRHRIDFEALNAMQLRHARPAVPIKLLAAWDPRKFEHLVQYRGRAGIQAVLDRLAIDPEYRDLDYRDIAPALVSELYLQNLEKVNGRVFPAEDRIRLSEQLRRHVRPYGTRGDARIHDNTVQDAYAAAIDAELAKLPNFETTPEPIKMALRQQAESLRASYGVTAEEAVRMAKGILDGRAEREAARVREDKSDHLDPRRGPKK